MYGQQGGGGNIIDAEFYSSNDGDESETNPETTATTTTPPTSTSTSTSQSSHQRRRTSKKISPLQASLSSVDPKLSSLSFNFIDPSPLKSSSKQRFIPCRVAYTITYDGVEYVLGTPVDTQVGIYVEDTKTQKAYFLDPDEDDNMEIMERAASVFQVQYEHISLSDLDDKDDDDDVDVDDKDDDNSILNSKKRKNNQKLSIRFKRTPRTLTVEGDLSIITGNWKKDADGTKQFNELNDVAKNILGEIGNTEDSKSDDDFFDSFFTKELGSNYEEIALANGELDEQADELMELFNIPGLGTETDDVDGVKGLFDDIFNGKDQELAKMEEEMDKSNSNNGKETTETALRLVGFSDEGDDGKVYSLVQLLQPMILVAKNDPTMEFDERMLLTQEEADEIVPILEKQFEDEFQDAGISLRP